MARETLNDKFKRENEQARERLKEDFHALNAKRRARVLFVFIGMIVAFAVMVVVNINSGNVHIGMGEIARAIFMREGSENVMDIVWTIRMPRIIVSLLLGGALAMAGFLLQTFFENPIAGPYVLGISSGAKMVVAFVLIFFLQNAKHVSSFTVIAAAFVGSLLATLFILAVSQRIRNMAALLVAGIMVGYICNAVTEFMITFAEDSDIANLHGWSQGSFSGMTWTNVGICLVVVGAGFILTMILSKPIGAYQMGESYAQSLGVNIKFFRAALILLSSLLSACVTAFAGPISFVGIAVPFLVKGVMGTSKPLVVIPGCMLGGGVFCMVCDLIARLAFAPVELNISTVTAVFGAPVVIYMMVSRRRMR
ncbi:MAG: iron ABC transporter permease [Bacillota bacterium]|nr:iron ABC transporter permease [Bacillota bacterium]